MGRASRPKPSRLAEKLTEIRLQLALTQVEMLKRLDYQKSSLYLGHISEFEIGKREPCLPVLLRYARVAGVSLETIVDDELDLPKKPTKMPELNRSKTRVSAFKSPQRKALRRQDKPPVRPPKLTSKASR